MPCRSAGHRASRRLLAILTLLAIAALHAGHGYNVWAKGWKLPLPWLILFLPLILDGAGRLPIEQWLRLRHLRRERRIWH